MGEIKRTVLFIKQSPELYFRVLSASMALFIALATVPSFSQNTSSKRKEMLVPPQNYSTTDSTPLKEKRNNLPSPVNALLAVPIITGTVTNAYCYGAADGSIEYIISGTQSPYTYTWSNGTNGIVFGSCWNIIEINNPGGALTNYQVRVNVSFVSGMKADFSDIRFSNTANTLLYNYWLESATNSVSAVFWVRVPAIPAGLSQMRISYCDPSATSLSNGAATFEYFDDFNDDDVSDWTHQCNNVSEADETCTMLAELDRLKLQAYSHCGGPTTDGVESEAIKNITLPSGQYKLDVTTNLFICLHDACGDTARVQFSSYHNGSFIDGYWFIQQENSCGCLGSTWFEARSDAFTSTGASSEFKLQGEILDCGSGYIYQDDFRIRKFATATPTITIGVPEKLILSNLSQGNYTINVTDGNGDTDSKIFMVNQPALPTGIPGERCDAGTVDLSVTGTYTSYNWYAASGGGSPLASSSNYTTNNISTSTNYYVVGVGTNACESTPRIAILATVNPLPAAPLAADSSRCGTGSIDLKASGTGVSYNWYASPTGGPSLSTTSIYSPILSSSTTYYVSIVDANNCESSRTIVNAIIDPYSQGILTGADTILPGWNTNNMTLISKTGNVTHWEKSYTNSFATISSAFFVPDTFYSENNVMQTSFYRASIKSGTCPPAYSNVIEIRVNHPHTCFPDTAYTYSDWPVSSGINVLSNDTDIMGDALLVESRINYSTLNGGLLTLNNNGDFTYTPPPKYIGTDSINYIACDLYENPVSHCRMSALYFIIEDNRLANGGIIIYPTLSPNDDFLNDTWIIEGIEEHPDNKVSIFDRWGNLVFEESGYDNSDGKIWKGNANKGMIAGEKNLPDGTYFYMVELGGDRKSERGFVVIKR